MWCQEITCVHPCTLGTTGSMDKWILPQAANPGAAVHIGMKIAYLALDLLRLLRKQKGAILGSKQQQI